MVDDKTPNWEWIYTYSYAPDEIWESWRDKIEIEDWFDCEVSRVAKKVNSVRGDNDIILLLLADTHYNVNGTWDDTAKCLQMLRDRIDFDGIVHLGDFTDGMVSAKITREYIGGVLDDLANLGVRLYSCLGNHDTNYFRNNPERFTLGEQCELYLGGKPPRYSVSITEKLKLVFLDSFDPDVQPRYGYSLDCVEFLDKTLLQVKDPESVIVFSHLAPKARLQYWVNEIRGEAEIMSVIRNHSSKILAFINGHNHADLLYNEEPIPIISIANAKCEAYLERKPEDFITPERKLGTRLQECFDIMSINTKKKKIHFTRFGSGRDKVVENGEARWL